MSEIPDNVKKVGVKAGERVSICTCGQSKVLPYCDNSHREYNEENNTHFKSLKIWPDKDGELKVSSKNWE